MTCMKVAAASFWMPPSAFAAVAPVLISPSVDDPCVAPAGCGRVGVGAAGLCISPANAGQVRASTNAAVVRVFRIGLYSLCLS
jgi:hypothetical protein